MKIYIFGERHLRKHVIPVLQMRASFFRMDYGSALGFVGTFLTEPLVLVGFGK